MKAALLNDWNDLALVELDKPVPAAGEALIHVLYGGVCGSDITVYKGLHPTAKAPVVLCHEILGVVESLPQGYSGLFSVGQRVLMNPVVPCGRCPACGRGQGNVCRDLALLGIHRNGGFAEYTTVPVENLAQVSDKLPDEVAVLGEPFAVGYHVNKRAGTTLGDSVIIIGAGPIGIVVGLMAKTFGAKQVVISELNPQRVALVQKLGLEAINPAEEDLMTTVADMTGGEGFDIAIEASGSAKGLMQLPDLARIGGTILSLGMSGAPAEMPIGKISFKEMTMVGSRLYSQADFESAVAAMEKLAGEMDLSLLVTDAMPLDDAVAGIEKMRDGQNLGKIIIQCS